MEVINGHRLAMIEPDLYNDEIVVSTDTLCRWADRRFAKANRPIDDRKWRRSLSGVWLPASSW